MTPSKRTFLLVTLLGLAASAHAGGRHTATTPQPAATSKQAAPTSRFTATHISGEYMRGTHYQPTQANFRGFITVFGGSEGSNNSALAEALAQQGFEVLALYFFGQEGQRTELANVPLDFYAEVLEYIQRFPNSSGPLTIIGHSKGAELGLLLASHFEEVDHAILFAPSSHAFQGLDFQQELSSWTWQGEEVPYIHYRYADPSSWNFSGDTYPSLLAAYQSALKNDPNAEAARIPAENFSGDLVLFAGGEDALWPSAAMAKQIKAARPATAIYIYPEAGHYFGATAEAGPYLLGGQLEANARADHNSKKRMLKLLRDWHTRP